MPLKHKLVLGNMKFLPSDAAVLSRIETPKRPVAFPAYRTVYLRSIFDGRKP